MWSLRVVVAPPVLDDFPSLADAREPVQVQAFVTELPVEAIDTGILAFWAF